MIGRRVHPTALRPGSLVAVTCPASPVAQPERLARGVERLRELGLEVVIGATCGVRDGLWAGPDEARAAELLGFLRDPTIEAVIAGRGGVGCLRLLPYLEELPRDAPVKWLIGRSDLTALHLAILRRNGWIGLSGPMAATDLGQEAPASVIDLTRRHLFDPAPQGMIADPSLRLWRKGAAEGPLVPANLSLLCSMVGTPYLPDLAGAILVLEEIGEPPHRCDRMLTHLRLSGLLDGIAGMVFGQFTDCQGRAGDPSPDSLEALLRSHAGQIGVPTLAGFPYGHEPLFFPLPVGVRARFRADPVGLEILEGAAADWVGL